MHSRIFRFHSSAVQRWSLPAEMHLELLPVLATRCCFFLWSALSIARVQAVHSAHLRSCWTQPSSGRFRKWNLDCLPRFEPIVEPSVQMVWKLVPMGRCWQTRARCSKTPNGKKTGKRAKCPRNCSDLILLGSFLPGSPASLERALEGSHAEAASFFSRLALRG